MTNSTTHPVAREAADALAASRARADQNAAELAARIAERKLARETKIEVERKTPARLIVERKLRPEPKPVNVRKMELEAQIETLRKKLKRKAKPLGAARRLSVQRRIAELKLELKTAKEA
jgi:hypothetical protein